MTRIHSELPFFPICLTLFDGAGGAAGGAGASGASGGAAAGEGTGAGETQAAAPKARGSRSGESNILYGKQPTEGASVTGAQEQAAATSSDTLDARRAAFKDLINGEYKDQFTEATQQIINRRFKETKELEAQRDKAQPVLDLLFERYNISGNDMEALAKAVNNDSAYWEEAADAAGMTVEQYKAMQQLKRENAQLQAQQKNRQAQQQAQQQVQKWYQESEALKAKFPDFDLGKETQNPQFLNMLKSGVPVEHAYKVLHFDQMMSDALTTTAQRTQEAVTNNIRARGARPQENGASGQSGFTVKDDVHKLTKADRKEIAKQVRRGKKISF